MKKISGSAGNFVAQFGGVLAIVAAHANDLRGTDRREQRGLRQRKMVHAARGNVFQVRFRILRRVQKNTGDLFLAAYGFHESVARLVV